ncbi:DUF6912 family protein [Gordonia paraffinivorans]|uniref:Uncharacterized protein n=2 Tax=Gordonia paraffinivorans TaxID=175628 RepID=A0ABQ0IIY5_9ACTN|nr:hypothetical protein [Gordonia paraffinivorans]MBY4573629.1 hypothetical protein [Gordonia paraffinivorans]MCD2146811.1 hypothetical protein [Gordonia paraffinivorans]PWD41847.1 hypothetical protein ACN93_17150 [Gordonia paraffinivorans]VFA87962.1 Uncharacterised protein [Gordonia paraffinivorans]GAC83447.1 hypothetical protein GP2_012_00530 [Gordonia paraffinivorans NBRC 108238]
MRVYLPATLAMLIQLNSDGEFRPVGGTGFALTPALRESFLSGDDEELSEVAMREAARASLRLLAGEAPEPGDEAAEVELAADEQTTKPGLTPDLPPRRVVIAADVDDSAVTLRPDLDDAVVKVSGTVPLKAIASVHVDVKEAEDKVRAAVVVIDAADLGDLDAELAVGDAEDFDLAWYATQELPFLLELL